MSDMYIGVIVKSFSKDWVLGTGDVATQHYDIEMCRLLARIKVDTLLMAWTTIIVEPITCI